MHSHLALARVDIESRSEDYVAAIQYATDGITDYASKDAHEELRPLVSWKFQSLTIRLSTNGLITHQVAYDA